MIAPETPCARPTCGHPKENHKVGHFDKTTGESATGFGFQLPAAGAKIVWKPGPCGACSATSKYSVGGEKRCARFLARAPSKGSAPKRDVEWTLVSGPIGMGATCLVCPKSPSIAFVYKRGAPNAYDRFNRLRRKVREHFVLAHGRTA